MCITFMTEDSLTVTKWKCSNLLSQGPLYLWAAIGQHFSISYFIDAGKNSVSESVENTIKL